MEFLYHSQFQRFQEEQKTEKSTRVELMPQRDVNSALKLHPQSPVRKTKVFPQSEHKPGNASMMQFLILTELPWNKCVALHQEESTLGSWHKRGLLWVKHQILNSPGLQSC